MWGGGESWSSSDGENEDEDYDEDGAPPPQLRVARGDEFGVTRPVNYEHQYNELDDDVLGDDDNSDDDDDPWGYDTGKGKKKKADQRQEEDAASYMLFDFRHGSSKWPEGVELINNEQAAELLEKAKKDAEAEAKRLQEREALKDQEKDKDKDKEKKPGSERKKGMFSGWGGGGGGGTYGPAPFGGSGGDYDPWSSGAGGAATEEVPEKVWKTPDDAVFETLNDGSTALILPPGKRLKLDLSALLEGGDDKKEEREKKKKRRKKRLGKMWGWYGGDSNWKSMWKEWVNEYTVTMDIKIVDSLPREGLALFQTALVHAGAATKAGGRAGKLKQTDGEAVISAAGGVGILGSFGDVTKAKVRPGRWHRVAVSVRCSQDAKQKGELLTWVDAAGGAVVKSEAITTNGRFALDPASLFLFSSAQPAMMARTVAIRTVRVVAKASDDVAAKADLARDRLVSMFNLEREREIDAQRRGLSLNSLFAKPRPVWMAPALIGTFGDPFIEGTVFEGASCMAWSFQVVNLVFQRMLSDQQSVFASDAAQPTRAGLSDIAHIFERSAPNFKEFARLLRHPNNSQLMSFVRKLKQQITALPEGESLLLPAMVEGFEILLLLERVSERSYTLVVINTDPQCGLRHHAVSPAARPGRLMYRTCMVLAAIPKRNVLDDVFWLAVFNLSLGADEGDSDKFYDILLPFLTGKPLESSLVEAEQASIASAAAASTAASSSEGSQAASGGSGGAGGFGPWRTPQRAATQYVRCLHQAINFILTRRRGVSPLRCKQVGLAMRMQFVEMILNDLKFMHPDENGQRVCGMALKQLSYRAIKISDALAAADEEAARNALGPAGHGTITCMICLDELAAEAPCARLPCGHRFHVECADEMVKFGKANCPLCRDSMAGQGSVEAILDRVRSLVTDTKAELETAEEENVAAPPKLDLTLDANWGGNAVAWDDENDNVDPGQAVALQKFVPADMLQIPARVATRDEAVSALRLCDRLCTLLDNQDHCVKNTQFLILSLIEHVLVHVVPLPKPRALLLAGSADKRAGRSERKREKEDKRQKELWAKRDEMRRAKGSKRKGGENRGDEEAVDKESRVQEQVDLDPGAEAVKRATQMPCIWDADITYELQVELLMVMQRLMEHFSASVLSLQASKPLDAVRVIVPGCICAISDAIIRRRAWDHPSEACAHLMGQDKTGRQLGVYGFGIGVGSFATQTETVEMHTPELVIARAAILDYFDSPAQRKLEKIFAWEEKFQLNPGRPLVKYLRMISREIAMPTTNPHTLMLDQLPETSKMLKNYPELRCYRDVCFYWKFYLNPDAKAFPNFTDAMNLSRMDTVLAWQWNGEENGYRVDCGAQGGMRCAPNPNLVDPHTGRKPKADELPKHRYPSTATPSFYAPVPPIRTEDDCIYRPNLPTFEDNVGKQASGAGQVVAVGAQLGQRDSELLLSFLTVPYIRLPLVLNFFAAEDRVHKLASSKLRAILDSVLFEPGRHLATSENGVEPAMVPTQHPELLACPYGALLNELFYSPEVTTRSVVALLDAALALDTGSVCDEGAADFNSSVTIILYIARLGARVHSYIHFAVAHSQGKHDTLQVPMRQEPDAAALEVLKRAQDEIASRLRKQYIDLLNDYLLRLEEQTKSSPENEVLINRNSRLACDLHAHRVLCFRNSGSGGGPPLDQVSAITMVGSFIYLTTRHTWNKSKREHGRLLVPEGELYETLTFQRRRLVHYASDLKQSALDTVMQSALETATSLTGAYRVSAEVIDVVNQWGKLQGPRSAGRFIVVGAAGGSGGKGGEPSGSSRKKADEDDQNAPEELEDTGLQGVEMDLQLGQMTLRAKHLAALESEIANRPHVRELFGEHTMQASLLDRSEHRRRFKLIGLRHEIEYWPDGHTVCPAVNEKWERDYDPAELHESERWIPPLFEPVRKAFFNGPMPPAMQFMMVGGPLPENVEVAVLLGLHQHLGGPFKLVYLFRHYRCVQVYECVSHARQYWFTLHLATDSRYSLRHLQPSISNRIHPSPAWWRRGAGSPFPKSIAGKLVSNIIGDGDCYGSTAIIRDAAHESNLSGGREYYIPACLLFGLFPEALLDTHRFWQDETPLGTNGHRRLRGYPKEKTGEHLLIVDLMQDSVVAAATCLPQRVVRVERRSLAGSERNFRAMQRVAARVEALSLACKPPKGQKVARAARVDRTRKFAVDDQVEVLSSDLLSGLDDNTMVPSKVLCENPDGTYDLEHSGEWSWLGIVKGVPAVQIQLRSQLDVQGKGVWIWEGLSDSEDDAWCSDDSQDEEDKGEKPEQDAAATRHTLSFEQFGDLAVVLAAAGWAAEECENALSRIAAQGSGPFHDMKALASEIRAALSDPARLGAEGLALSSSGDKKKEAERCGPEAEERMLMLDLMYASRRSRLFSLAKTLSSVENLSHICVWTRNVAPARGSPCSIDLVELPRLKLSFTTREDHEGQLRLFSLDHADLFVSNQHNAFTARLMSVIPHSLLVSNLRGEAQMLVPVLPPCRPEIITEPFSTEIVLNRSDQEWIKSLSQHFYLYPIHVSLSFIMPRGLNSALYLLLLRLLNRDYNSAFRMCDSIATDSKLSPEGTKIFDALGYATDDLHPDAHAVRLKVSLVTMESGAQLPWDLTDQLAKYISKLPHVSATCFISEQEELQLLSSDAVVLDDQSPKYKPDVHDVYSMTLVKNRLHQLRVVLSAERGTVAPCFAPPRAPSTGWPWYQDNTVFGEQYNEAIDIKTAEDWSTRSDVSSHNSIRSALMPPGGWLSVVMVHVLWSADSVKLMPRYAELVPMYPFVTFFTVRADVRGLDRVVKEYGVDQFPSFLLMRGGKMLPGTLITGQDRVLERLMRSLAENVGEADRAAYTHYLARQREEAGAIDEEGEGEKVESETFWNWDVDCCGSSMQVHEQGLAAELCDADDDRGEPAVWEHQDTYYDEWTGNEETDTEWKPLSEDIQHELERRFLRGSLYQSERLTLRGARISRPMSMEWSLRNDGRGLQISSNLVEGFTGYWDDADDSFKVRRVGERVKVKGEEKVLSKAQEEIDLKMQAFKEQKEAISRFRRQQRRGKNVEAIRGSVGFTPGSGLHKWTLRWSHEPQMAGTGDAVGVASAQAEAAGPCEPPLLGGRYDEGASVGLYASGVVLRNTSTIYTVDMEKFSAQRAVVAAAAAADAAAKAAVKKAADAAAKEAAGKEGGSPTAKEGDAPATPAKATPAKATPATPAKATPTNAAPAPAPASVKSPAKVDTQEDATEGKQKATEEGEEAAAAEEVEEPVIAPLLWNKGSLVTCVLDTDTKGGRLTFEVDGVAIDFELTGLFALLGGEEVFPVVCMFPVESEEDLEGEDKEDGEGEGEGFKKGDRVEGLYKNGNWYLAVIARVNPDGTFLLNWDDKDSEDRVKTTEQLRLPTEEGEESEEEEEEQSEGALIEELAKACKLEASEVAAMSLEEREQLAAEMRRSSEAGKRARVTMVFPVPPPDFFTSLSAAASKSAAAAAAKEEGEKAEGAGASADEKGEEGEEGKDEEEQDAKEAAANADDQSIDRIRWMWETSTGQWEVYSPEVSRELEMARRGGQLECSLRIGELNVACKVQGAGDAMSQESNGETQRLRRHVMKEGLEGQWEVLSVVYKPPFSLYGESALKILQKVWKGDETMSGKSCNLSFLFLYALFQGSIRCRVITSGYSDWWKSGSSGFGFGGFDSKGYGSSASGSDAHRFGLLLAQLYADRNSKSVYSSVINVLGRNKQLCVRMPEFKDTRKSRQSSVFNGWVDSREPRSAISDLFNKVVPLLQGLKRSKQGALVFPPKPPHPELPQPPATCPLPPRRLDTYTPELSDLDCGSRQLRAISGAEVRALAAAVKHQFGPARDAGEPPLEVDDEMHAEALVAASPTTLFVLFFHASWCHPCAVLAPIVRRLAVSTPAARFLRLDADTCDMLAFRLRVKSVPTIKVVRGGLRVANVLGTIEGLDEDFYARFRTVLMGAMTAEERMRTDLANSGQLQADAEAEMDRLSQKVVGLLQATEQDIELLTTQPMAALGKLVDQRSRLGRGLSPIGSAFSFDVSKHEAARTAVAQSMLQRMKEDLHAFAKIANELPDPKLTLLSEDGLRAYFADQAGAADKIHEVVRAAEDLMTRLQELRLQDETAVNHAIALITRCANFVDIAGGGYLGRRPRTEFLLRRAAGQAAEAWPEFLFGSLISSRGEEDVRVVNPYLPSERVDAIVQLVMLTMLRANRMGHVSRCVGSTIVLLKLLRQILGPSASQETHLPMLLQASDDLADVISSGRHYGVVKAGEGGKVVELDPRFLIFEFAWNILLRQKQVEIVRDFVGHIREGSSKVKQMIMGAGKTTVVAPLLALILADSKSLLLSVVPKALLEMSRTQMRETFANIIPKRVYTFKFERSTSMTPGMRLALENAARNRGIVVATPTSLKSVMLVYIEALRQLDDAWNPAPGTRPPSRETIDGLARQAQELAGVLRLFQEGVMLLDEVDLILHPLKSELNFPLGEKHAIDCSDAGERWTLPIHILDAIYYQGFGRASAFEARGVALDILRRIGVALSEGYAVKALQRLPHVTLLNPSWYHSILKPLMAEWIYLWLQKQHLHGISRLEAVTYILEGAVARSEAAAKVACFDAALAKVESELGIRPPLTPVPLTPSHLASLGDKERHYFEEETEHARIEASHSLEMQPARHALLDAERNELERAREAAQRLHDLVHELYHLDEQVDTAAGMAGRRLAELQEQMVRLQKEIQELESPRDDSFDNSTVVWASEVFTKTSGAVGGGAEASRYGDEATVLLACGKLEELGLTVKRCGTFDEAVERAWQLRSSGHLRCLIAGGEPARGCGRNCVRSHDGDGNCIVCGSPWSSHSGHSCSDGRQGSWIVKGRSGGSSGGKGIDGAKLTMSLLDDVPVGFEPIPPSRLMLFASGGSSGGLREDKRLALWKKGVAVTEDKSALLEWAEAQPSWMLGEEGDDDDAPPPPVLKRELSSGLRTLKSLRQRLQDVEKMKEAAQQEEDSHCAAHRQVIMAKHAELEECIQRQLSYLVMEVTWARELLPTHEQQGEVPSSAVGPANGREAALALAYLKTHQKLKGRTAAELEASGELARVQAAARSVAAEHKWLSQAALAAKVMAHVTSPTQKKLLNLSYDWLRTFLPHVMAKVNRVSYGLLSSEDCAAAIEAAPNVPRSRLKLCVPFVGKDVPSKSSEFAHPDVIIGLTILAYRYSGMRYEDFVDLVDALTSEFVQEIGPARDRPASRRHESWVLAAGGRIRGISRAVGDASARGATAAAAAAGGEDGAGKEGGTEVVQLKFLQKSNAEQMEKLFQLWRLEPLAIHYYLTKFIFPAYMLSQRVKLSASGQAVGGDMLVGRRVGFSGTPSDLLPKELGKCDYATGDDGRMLTTILDTLVASHELLPGDWSVPSVLRQVAVSASPRYHALIDTGALITGYSNREVAAFLLAEGLEWCDGVVFLDDNDEKQVLVRATGRAVPADQCGVPLDRRFAFYDQIHTTGMDIKHVVNAVAVITLGKDMVFRDYVQGAYRMRGIGCGQKIRLFIIPEVHDLVLRELRAAGGACAGMAAACADGGGGVHMLEAVVSWLVINSMRTEQTQWSMLCLQNVANIYRKNAFSRVLSGADEYGRGPVDKPGPLPAPAPAEVSKAQDAAVMALPLRRSLRVFDEHIDFSLEAAVPDPIPFEAKLRELLTSHDEFILTAAQHALGHGIMGEVAAFSLVSEAGNLDTEQEREQEQEQEKEVKARRDQQVEVEKFVEREYSRHQERPNPWPVSMLACDPFDEAFAGDKSAGHPFYPLRDFSLLLHASLPFPGPMLLSRNYYHPGWSGLRRLKNVVVVMEWSPSAHPDRLQLLTDAEHAMAARLGERQEAAVQRAHALLAFHKGEGEGGTSLSREGLSDAVHAATSAPADSALVGALYHDFAEPPGGVTATGMRRLLVSGRLRPEHRGRYWVAVSLSEAETLRRVLHLRRGCALPGASGGPTTSEAEVALHLSQPAAAGALAVAGSARGWGGMLDLSRGWRSAGSGATAHEAAVALGCFRFFDCDMHYSRPMLARVVRALQSAAPHDREQFFLATVGARRRMERKWQETPLAAVFSVDDEWVALKQRAQAAFVREALRARGVTSWEAFVAFDADNNARLSPSELYGALRWLAVPGLTADDVVDFFELADRNRDGMIDYVEYAALFEEEDEAGRRQAAAGGVSEATEEDEEGEGSPGREPLAKVEPYGADELREVMVARRRRELDRQRLEQARRAAQQAAMDFRLYREELQASARRAGGSNPRVHLPTTDAETLAEYSGLGEPPCQRLVVFSFFSNRHPLRAQVGGKCKYLPILIDEARKRLQPPRCPSGHQLTRNSTWSQCHACSKYGSVSRGCMVCWVWMCTRCATSHEEEQVKERSDPAGKHTFLQCELGADISLQIPPATLDSAESVAAAEEAAAADAAAVAAVISTAASGSSEVAPAPRVVPLAASDNFSITVELKIPGLPARGQLAALLRFSPPDMAQARRRHIASLYLDSEGALVHDPESAIGVGGGRALPPVGEAPVEEAEAEVTKGPRLREGRWIVLSVAVEPAEGRLTAYMDGRLAARFEGIESGQLRLGPRVVVLGGGKAAQSRGGSVRRVLVHDQAVGPAAALSTYAACARNHPTVGGRLVRVQAAWRGRAARQGLEKEGLLQLIKDAKKKK